jgi:hypothetical protein
MAIQISRVHEKRTKKKHVSPSNMTLAERVRRLSMNMPTHKKELKERMKKET